MRRWTARLWNLLRRDTAEHEMAREMEAHLALMQADFERRGLEPREARYAALRAFGGVEQSKELHRETRGLMWLEQFWQDLRYALRNLRKAPGFTSIAVVTLALGIGANAVIFSVVNAVLFKPLAYKDADRLVTILHSGNAPVGPANYLDWQAQSVSFEAMGAAQFWTPNLTGTAEPEHLRALQLSQNLLPLLGVEPLLGRVLAGEREVVLTHGLWTRRFNADPLIVGKPVSLDGEPYTVVGVMPPAFRFAPFWATRAELYAPLVLGKRAQERGGNSLRVFARLKPGVELDRAQAEISAITGRLEQQFPGSNRNVKVTALKEKVTGKVQTPLLLVLGAVGFVLLIACANVAHMVLARTTAREREFALRMALGATRWRLLVQFVTESLVLAALGATAGLALAVWGLQVLVAASPAYLPRMEMARVDGDVLLFLLGITGLTALLFGVAPALRTMTNLKGAQSRGPRGVLVASEFALATVLLVGAGLMIRSVMALRDVDPGFRPERVLSMVVSVNGAPEESGERREGFYRQLLDDVRRVPGIESVGAINHLPLVGDLWGWNFAIEGRGPARPGEAPMATYRIVMPGYFDTMRLPLVRGRLIGEGDDRRGEGVVVINERAAEEYWPGQEALGQRITFTGTNEPPEWLTVVGIVKNAKQLDWAAEPSPEVYLSALQNGAFLGQKPGRMGYITLVARASGDPGAMIPAVKNAVWNLNRNLPVSQVLTMERAVDDAMAQPRFEMMLLTVFGAVALALAAVGIYGVMSYAVARRTREIGIRISLGATRGEVVGLVVRQGMRQVIVGTCAGVAGALALSRLMSAMLYGVRPADVTTFVAVTGVLALSALGATLIPARRASRIEPTMALRSE